MTPTHSPSAEPPVHERSGTIRLSELFRRAGVLAALPPMGDDVRITSLSDDTRRLRPGGCFVAVRGTSCDGHRFVRAAVDAGAAAIVVERDVGDVAPAVAVQVDETSGALARLAAAYFGRDDPTGALIHPIGITGTNGKTTVAWMLRSILGEAGLKPALLGTIEYDLISRRCAAGLTTPGAMETARLLAETRRNGATHVVMEVSSHALAQRRCDGLSFGAGVFTNLSGDHLDYHGTMDQYAAAKRRLFELLAVDAPAIVNLDDPMGKWLAERLDGRVVTYGLESPGACVTARIEAADLQGCRFVLNTASGRYAVRLPLAGRHNVLNAIAAAAAAEALGVSVDGIQHGLESLAKVPGRLERVTPDESPVAVFVDYAHTDGALSCALSALRPLTTGRLICVFGCGGDRDRTKRPRMARAAAACADVVIVTSDNPRTEDPMTIIDEITAGFPRDWTGRTDVEPDRRRAIEAAIRSARSGDTVLIAGKGHETDQRFGDRVRPFDDVKVAREFLVRAGASGDGR